MSRSDNYVEQDGTDGVWGDCNAEHLIKSPLFQLLTLQNHHFLFLSFPHFQSLKSSGPGFLSSHCRFLTYTICLVPGTVLGSVDKRARHHPYLQEACCHLVEEEDESDTSQTVTFITFPMVYCLQASCRSHSHSGGYAWYRQQGQELQGPP